ncbi:MAG: hypothetical protein RR482_00460 [Clostridia bacterium]
MGELIFILIVISVISSFVQKAKEEQSKQKRQGAHPQARGAQSPRIPFPQVQFPGMSPVRTSIPPEMTEMTEMAEMTPNVPAQEMQHSLQDAARGPLTVMEDQWKSVEGVDPCHDGMEAETSSVRMTPRFPEQLQAPLIPGLDMRLDGAEMVKAIVMSEILNRRGGRCSRR